MLSDGKYDRVFPEKTGIIALKAKNIFSVDKIIIFAGLKTKDVGVYRHLSWANLKTDFTKI